MHLISLHLISLHLISLHLISLPLKFTSTLFQKIRRCAPHIETHQRPPTLTLGSTFRIQYHHIPITASRLFHSQHPFRPLSSIGSAFRPQHRHIHITASRLFHSRHPFRPLSSIGSAFRPHHRRIYITASRLFHSQQPLQAVLLHRLNLSFPTPSHTDTSQQNSRSPQPSTP